MMGGSTRGCFWIEWRLGRADNNLHNTCFTLSDSPSTTSGEGIPDTAATNHYIDNDNLTICKNITPTSSPRVAVAMET